MAMSSAVRVAGQNMKSFNVIATADADTGNLVIAHGMITAPGFVHIDPLLNAGVLSNWSWVSADATNITLNKGATTAGSGNAGAQLAVTAMIPHSMVA